MLKTELLNKILLQLTADLDLLTTAAKSSHAASTHEECLPDNKYDTTALEASYIAQGQANRAQEIRLALEDYRNLNIRPFNDETPIRLSALITLVDDDDLHRHLFLGPSAGGLKVSCHGLEYLVITPDSALGRALLGRHCGDEVQVGHNLNEKNYTIIAVC